MFSRNSYCSTRDSTGCILASIGPFAAPLLSSDLPTQAFEYFQGQKVARDSIDITSQLNKMSEQRLNKVVEQTSHEITRIYEYQIAMLRSLHDVKQLAFYAVQHIFERAEYWLTESYRVPFTFTELLKLLLQPNYDVDSMFGSLSQVMDAVYNQFLSTAIVTLNTVISDSTVWQPYEVFEKVGLRCELLGGDCEYRTSETRLNPKCGFRAQFLEFDEHFYRFAPSEIDAQYTVLVSDVSDQRAVPYESINRLVFQEELDLYVFGDISGGDFSHCDLSSMHLKGVIARE
eukprot:gene27496-34221_t